MEPPPFMETDPGDRCAEKQDPRPAQWRRPRPIGQALEVETKDRVGYVSSHLNVYIYS